MSILNRKLFSSTLEICSMVQQFLTSVKSCGWGCCHCRCDCDDGVWFLLSYRGRYGAVVQAPWHCSPNHCTTSSPRAEEKPHPTTTVTSKCVEVSALLALKTLWNCHMMHQLDQSVGLWHVDRLTVMWRLLLFIWTPAVDAGNKQLYIYSVVTSKITLPSAVCKVPWVAGDAKCAWQKYLEGKGEGSLTSHTIPRFCNATLQFI